MPPSFGPEAPTGQSASDYCHITPDVYPELSRRRSLRPLPKQLHQSRMFTLDLDQQRKSTRVENCLVHLDAVQNPMTCFHLSINWLNCTNHLIDEMVQGWSRVAERCGMRLIEAPRAQDMVLHANHPFHSPIRINLLHAPPPVESIFDEEWIREFGSFGDSDSEPESSSSSSSPDIGAAAPGCSSDSDDNGDKASGRAKPAGDLPSKRRRARIVRRMAKCLPAYAFERELLEGQDFILDVEAESSYPDGAMLQRDYTFERQGHRHTQYVHRSGTAFVQICGPGQFLWINNYLFTSHQTHLRPQAASQQQQQAQQQAQQQQQPPGNSATAVTAATATAATGADQAEQLPPPVPASNSSRQLAPPPPPPPAAPSTTAAGSRMVPAYYPMRSSREMWPHQVLETLMLDKTKRKAHGTEDTYRLQIIDHVGAQAADFDSVNAAITRAADSVSREEERPPVAPKVGGLTVGGGGGDEASEKSLAAAAAAEATSGLQQQHQTAEPNPDVLRAHFIEMCDDKNSLVMFWEQTIERYRSGWRDYMSGKAAASDLPRGRPMIIDLFSEGLWQKKWSANAAAEEEAVPPPSTPPPRRPLSPPLAPPPPPLPPASAQPKR
ncbi:vacuolar membrane-associated protein iml1 [Coemansia sp. RSA 2424]|nr:vacuolar membrane-associated protein iml1 [Coemansia sp. RSA 2424]